MSTKKKVSYKVGNHVILNQDREGFIRYIGTTSFASGKWYGIELSNGNVGQHNGTFAGKKYFECDELRGIFVRKKEILRLFTSKDANSPRRQSRRESLQIITNKHPSTKSRRASQKALQQEQRIQKKLKKRKKRKGKKVKINSTKLDSTMLSKPKGKKKRKNKKSRSLHDFIERQRDRLTKQYMQKHTRNNSYTTNKNNNLNEIEFLKEKLKTYNRDVPKIKIHKAGPCEIGRNKYKGTKINNDNNNESHFLDLRMTKSTPVKQKVRKQGPIEIGRVKSTTWKPIKYKIRINDKDFLSERLTTRNKNNKKKRYNKHSLKKRSKKKRKSGKKKEIKFKQMEMELNDGNYDGFNYVNRYDSSNKNIYDDNVKFNKNTNVLNEQEYKDLERSLDALVMCAVSNGNNNGLYNKMNEFDSHFKKLEMKFHDTEIEFKNDTNNNNININENKDDDNEERFKFYYKNYSNNNNGGITPFTPILNNHMSKYKKHSVEYEAEPINIEYVELDDDTATYYSDINGIMTPNMINTTENKQHYGSDGDIKHIETYFDIDDDDEKRSILYDEERENFEEHSTQKGRYSIDLLRHSSTMSQSDDRSNRSNRSSTEMINVKDINLSELIKDDHITPKMEPIMESPNIDDDNKTLNLDDYKINAFDIITNDNNNKTKKHKRKKPSISKSDSIIGPGLADVPQFLDYIGKWCIIFDDNINTKYYYNIKKSGKVLIQPKNSFGWKNRAHIVYDEYENLFEITSTNMLNTDEYHHVLMDKNNKNTFKIFKYNMSNDSFDCIQGNGNKILL